MTSIRRIFPLLILSLCLCLPALASAEPSTDQRFDAKLVGNSKAGTSKKPAAVGLFINPFHEVGIAGGPKNTGGLNSGAVMESPAFSTKFANVWLPKQLKFNNNSFPGCDYTVALGYPDDCPKGSEVGLTNSDPNCGKTGKPACTIYATGLVRSKVLNPDESIAGLYALALTLSVRIFVVKNDEKGNKVKDTLALRVISPTSGNVIMPGKLSKATGAEAKKYGYRMRFTIPRGLVAPTDGLISQLTNFAAGIKKVSYKGKPFVGLTSCPSNKKLNFGYNGEYVINGQKNPSSTNPDNEFVIGEVGPIINKEVACKK